MRRFVRIILAAIFVVFTVSVFFVAAFAATPQDGWHTDENGVERYYRNGSYITGKQQIGEYTYLFDGDGRFVRMIDDFRNIGTYGTMDTQAYKDAIAALGSKVYLNFPITTQDRESSRYIYDGLEMIETGEKGRYIYNGNTKIGIMLKDSSAKFISKGDGNDENLAIQTWQSLSGKDPYVNVHTDTSTLTAAEDVVAEFEVKLGDDFVGKTGVRSLLQFIDRGHNGTKGNNVFMGVVSYNNDGCLLVPNYSSTKYIAQLTQESYTRISVALHPLANTCDVYINGVLVVEGVTFIKSPESWYSAEAFKATELRIAHYSSASESENESFCIDNVYMYAASKPVCTETPEPRNGVYVSGGAYLRYYQDNMLVGGYKTVDGTYFGKTYSSENVLFDKYGKYFVGSTATMYLGVEKGESFTVDKNVFIAPKAIDFENKVFVGWKVTHNGTVAFLSPGQSMRINSDIKYEPVAITYEMLDGASVRTNSESTGLRFMAQIAKSNYQMLTSLGVSVKTHMMIVPTEYIELTHGYTTVEAFEKLEAEGYAKRIDVTPSKWYYTGNEYHYYVGSVGNILPENYMLEYSGIAYLEITDPKGETRLVYADYNEKNNSRSVYYVASRAYNDRVSGNAGSYSYEIEYKGANTYSPYDKNRLGVIKSFVDKVVMLNVDDNGVRTVGEYYEAPYELSVTGDAGSYSVSVKNKGAWTVSDAVGISLNGKKLGDGEFTKNDLSVSIPVSYRITDLKNYEGASVDEWYMADPSKSTDKSFFGSTSGFPTPAPNGAVSGYLWNFSTNKTVTFFDKSYKYLGWDRDNTWHYAPKWNNEANANVLDMSDWVTLEFYYLADESEVGSRFKLIFYSENPATTAGMDYYSYEFSVGKSGWNNVRVAKKDAKADRTPLGWDKITKVAIVTTGWNMDASNGDYTQSFYVTSMKFEGNNKFGIDYKGISQLNNSATFYPGAYAAVVNGVRYVINGNDVENAVVFKDGNTNYIPVNVLAEALADEATYYEAGDVLKMTFGGNEYRFAEGKDYFKNGVSVSLKKAAKVRGNRLFISAEDAMAIFGYKEMYVDIQGLVVLSNTKNIFTESDSETVYKLINEITYRRPMGEKVYNDLMEHSGGVHPYIMLNQADFDRLNYYKKMDDTLASYIRSVNSSYGVGSKRYNEAPKKYELPDGQRLLSVSREVLLRVQNMSLLYKLYEHDDPESAELLAERIWTEVEAVCNFPDWHPAHYLDTAEMAYAVSIGYDWLYDYWQAYDNENGTDRIGTMERTLYNYSLKTTSSLTGGTYNYNLGGATNNWNGVCNGGTMAAALALVTNPDYRGDAITVIETIMFAVEKGLWVYGPDGGYEEGPGYWDYGTTYLHVLMSSLDSACGTNYGLYATPGFAESVYFTTYLGSMNTAWGFHDGGSGSPDTKIASWFAKKSNDGNVNAIRRQAIDNGWKNVSLYDILWFEPHTLSNSISLELDAYYSLDAIMSFRDSWNEKSNLFTGLHGGDNSASHGDLDIGNFIISVNGVHIIGELNAENYNIAGYFGGYRWSYYRKRAEGQNTLVMLPHGESWNGKTGIPYADPNTNKEGSSNRPVPDQVENAISKCLRYETGKNSALGVVDMSPAYSSYVSSEGAIRGLWFKDNRSTIVIQDEGSYNKAMDIWWFAHTEGKITVSSDGKSALIDRNGLYLYAEIVTDIANAKFTVMDAESLDESYVGDTTSSTEYENDTEKSRNGISKLCVKAENVTEYKLAVVFKVVGGENDVPELGTTYTWTDIEYWKVD